jgi:hypothetical protein
MVQYMCADHRWGAGTTRVKPVESATAWYGALWVHTDHLINARNERTWEGS